MLGAPTFLLALSDVKGTQDGDELLKGLESLNYQLESQWLSHSRISCLDGEWVFRGLVEVGGAV